MERSTRNIIEFYDDFFQRGGFNYYPPEFTRRVLAALCRRARVRERARVLDVGCATGYYSGMFASMGYDVTGIDFSKTAIDKAREYHPDIRFEVMDATRMTFEQSSFDMIFASGLSVANTKYLPELHAILLHIMRFVAPGGTLAFLSGSTLTGRTSPVSTWFNHKWQDIRNFPPPELTHVRGPWLTHFRIMKLFPSFLSLNAVTTRLLLLAPASFERRIVLFLENK